MGTTSEIFIEMRQKIQAMADAVLDGELNAFEIGRELVYTKNACESAKEKISECEKIEFAKYSPQELKKMKIQLSGGGYTWKFDHIPEWVELNQKLTAIEDKAKSAFKAMNSNLNLSDNETGEVFTPANATPKKQSVSYR